MHVEEGREGVCVCVCVPTPHGCVVLSSVDHTAVEFTIPFSSLEAIDSIIHYKPQT